MLMPAFAKGSASEATMPVRTNPKGPATLNAFQSFSTNTPPGICVCGQTTESSSKVFAKKNISPESAHSGIGLSLSNRQTPNVSGSSLSVSFSIQELYHRIYEKGENFVN